MKAALVSIAVLCSIAGPASAGDRASHTVTVTVTRAAELTVGGERVPLAIADPAECRDAGRATGETACGLVWTVSEAAEKITAEAGHEALPSALTVEAVCVTGGKAVVGDVKLCATPSDFVIGGSARTGSCGLRYVLTAAGTLGASSDVHTVLYTITAY